jgi:phosphoserine phosphatase
MPPFGDDNALRVARLTTLLDIARQIGATTDLRAVLHQVEKAALDVMDCERVTIFLFDPKSDELFSEIATGTGEIRFSSEKGIAGEALQSDSAINIPDAYADERFNPAVDKSTGFRTRNLLTLPMHGHEGNAVAVLQLVNKHSGTFSKEDESLASALASITGVAIQRARLLDAYAEKLRMERDLSIAQDIQRSLLPAEDPSVEGFDMAGWSKAADETGGDFYDFIPLSGGRVGIVLADASGHGIGPALVASECRAILRALGQADLPIDAVMTRANQILDHDLAPGRFITTFLGFLDPAGARIEYVSGGHAPLLLYRGATGERISLDATTLPMGIVSFFDGTPADPIDFDTGDILILLTDGFHEWANAVGDDFGVDRCFDAVEACRDSDSKAIIQALHEAVVEFAGGTPQSDDLTAIILKKC